MNQPSDNQRIAVVALLFLVSPSMLAAFEVSQLQLSTGVQDFSGPFIVQDFDYVLEVQNPLSYVSDAAIGANTAQTAYDLSWLLDDGTFHLDVAHHLETSEIVTASVGFLLIEPDSDLRMTIDASLDYSSVPGDQAFVRLWMFVRDLDTNELLFSESQTGGNAAFEPASGTLALAGDFTLPAGNTSRIQYIVDADNLSEPNPDGPIDTSGFIHFELLPVPEPGTLILLAVGLLAVHRKRR